MLDLRMGKRDQPGQECMCKVPGDLVGEASALKVNSTLG